ncbi:uncharacterized protein LOC132797962 [Drosophila nasuta]|uniref:uncharacterized protein LOC132797962 n=1 Tax=Drosophila nasuta TaxID=42062 RepID=UPI00295E6B3B|nr:uncharacterized protein LOC132797962 [Drosophila nasuta]
MTPLVAASVLLSYGANPEHKTEDNRTPRKRSALASCIPSLNLRNQTRIQRFGDPEQMLQAIAHICLSKYGAMGGTKTTAQSNDKRGHNCNSKGHFAKECRKPKREPGSCYACGEMGHVIAECKKKKSVGVFNKSTGFDNSYNAS